MLFLPEGFFLLLIFHRASWYVWGWCMEREDFRLFKLNRMSNLQTGIPFKKRQVSLPDLSQEQVFPPVYEVKAKIQKEYKWRLVEAYGPDSFVQQEEIQGMEELYNEISVDRRIFIVKKRCDEGFAGKLELDTLSCGWQNVCGNLSE